MGSILHFPDRAIQPRPLSLTFHEDAGHGWLEVPEELFLKYANFVPSGYSYYKDGKLYLEEDCDATKWNKCGPKFTCATKYVEDSPIRNYPRINEVLWKQKVKKARAKY